MPSPFFPTSGCRHAQVVLTPTHLAPRGRLRVAFQTLSELLESKGAESFSFLQSYNKLESHQMLNESVHWIKKKINLTSRLLDYWG